MTTLFNRFEAMTEEGLNIYSDISNILKPSMEKYSEKYSTIELEYIYIGVVTGLLADLRIRKAMALKKNEKENNN